MQALRNCDGKGSPAKIELNGQLYRRCPRAISLENSWARHIVDVYMDCRRMNTFPVPGGPLVQTRYTIEFFDFMEGVLAEFQQNQQAKANAAAAKKDQKGR
jgi:hypothetical protein